MRVTSRFYMSAFVLVPNSTIGLDRVPGFEALVFEECV